MVLIFSVFSMLTVGQDLSSSNCPNLIFRHVVVSNNIQTSKIRDIEVFMDPKDFSPDNLKSLFSFLSTKFPSPEYLFVNVYTDWSQLPYPPNCGVGFGGIEGRKVNNIFHRAKYYRQGRNVFFYYTNELGIEKMEKVVISGDRQPKQPWEQ